MDNGDLTLISLLTHREGTFLGRDFVSASVAVGWLSSVFDIYQLGRKND